jgi:hypothetical protein
MTVRTQPRLQLGTAPKIRQTYKQVHYQLIAPTFDLQNTFFYVSVSVHRKYILYKEPTGATLAALFISHCKITI